MAAGLLRKVHFGMTEEGTFGLLPEAPEVSFKPYPSVRYHATLNPKIVKSREADEKLGKEWSKVPIRPQDGDTRVDDDE